MYRKQFFFLLVLAFLLGVQTEAQAVFTMTATPRRGGQNLRFEESRPGSLIRSEEVTVAVTSTQAAQYTVSLTSYQPLTNSLGNVIPQDAFIVSSPSSPLGTLMRIQSETSVMMGQVPIFTSNSAGDSDTFVLAFNVRVPDNQPGGIYHSQLTFTADLVNHQSGVSPAVVNMDVEVEIRPTFRVTVKSQKGGRGLDLGHVNKDRPVGSETLDIRIESNIGTTYRLIQQMTEPLVSEDGVSMNPDAFTFVAGGGEKGSLMSRGTPVPVPQASAPFYTSDSFGQSDNISLQYALKPDAIQRAGVYTGNISFKVESQSPFVQTEIINVPVKLELESIFDLEIQVDQGGSSLHFGTFRTGDEKQEKRVTLTVHSNLGKPYQVTQIVSRKLTNEEGVTIPPGNFLYYGSQAKTGTIVATAATSVSEGESPVFTSDQNGSPDQIILDYTLALPKGIRAGSYTSDVRYSISTL